MPSGNKGVTRKPIPEFIRGQRVIAVEPLLEGKKNRRVLLECACGSERWCALSNVKPSCARCSAAKRSKRPKPGAIVGYYTVLSYVGVSAYSRGISVLEVRDNRCGHVNRLNYRSYIKGNGLKSLCNCPIRRHNDQGYVLWDWKGPNGNRVQVAEHRIIMEQHIGRELFPDENVHHVNGVRDDNQIENLELWSSSQPSGQRVKDKLAWARMIIERYGETAGLALGGH